MRSYIEKYETICYSSNGRLCVKCELKWMHMQTMTKFNAVYTNFCKFVLSKTYTEDWKSNSYVNCMLWKRTTILCTLQTYRDPAHKKSLSLLWSATLQCLVYFTTNKLYKSCVAIFIKTNLLLTKSNQHSLWTNMAFWSVVSTGALTLAQKTAWC